MGDGSVTRLGLLANVYRSWKAKLLTGIPIGAAIYQFLCDQFGLPTIPQAWTMTGALFPWWGWLLVAQVGAVYGLFEYVRLNISPHTQWAALPVQPILEQDRYDELDEEVKPRLGDLPLQEVAKRVAAALKIHKAALSARDINLEIADKAFHEELTLSGRYCDFPVDAIRADRLEHATFNFARGELTVANGWGNTLKYTEVKFLSSEIDDIWPEVEE